MTGPTGTGPTGPTGVGIPSPPLTSVQFNSAGVFGGDAAFRWVTPNLFLGAGAPGTDSMQQGSFVGGAFMSLGGATITPSGVGFNGRFIRIGNIVVFGWALRCTVTGSVPPNHDAAFSVELTPTLLPALSEEGIVWYGTMGSPQTLPTFSSSFVTNSTHRLTNVGGITTLYEAVFQYNTSFAGPLDMTMTGLVVYQTVTPP